MKREACEGQPGAVLSVVSLAICVWLNVFTLRTRAEA